MNRGGISLKSGKMEHQTFSGGLNKINSPKTSGLRSLKEIKTTHTAFDSESLNQLKVGYEVIHEKFGKGKVIQLIGQGADKRAVIFFPKEGSKTILLKFAKLEVIKN